MQNRWNGHSRGRGRRRRRCSWLGCEQLGNCDCSDVLCRMSAGSKACVDTASTAATMVTCCEPFSLSFKVLAVLLPIILRKC